MPETRPHQRVANILMKRVFKGDLKPGEKLPPLRRLSEEMKVDHASMRIALKQLEIMNLLEIRRSDGVYVRDFMQHAGLDFLSAIFRSQEADAGESLVDKYLVDEVWAFWIAFLPEVVRMAGHKFSPRDVRELMETMEKEMSCLHDRDRLIELEIFLQDRIAAVADNLVVSLWFNSTRPLRRKMIEVFIRSISPQEMENYIVLRRQMIDDFMVADTPDLDAVIDAYRDILRQLWQSFRRAQQVKVGQP